MGDAKTRPILFSGDMVRAILDGRKTQTRRPIKPQPELSELAGFVQSGRAYGLGMDHAETMRNFARYQCPYGATGDLLRVVSTWGTTADLDAVKPSLLPRDARIWTVADGERPSWVRKMRPGRFMPLWMRERMPLLENRAVRPERVQDITEEDARAEGVDCASEAAWFDSVGASDPYAAAVAMGYRAGFREAWKTIYGAASWDANPWVWAVTFRRVP